MKRQSQKLNGGKWLVMPFRLNISAYDIVNVSSSCTVGGASCPADFARRLDFLSVSRKFLELIGAINALAF